MRSLSLVVLSLASLLLAGCGGNVGTSQTGDQPDNSGPYGDDDGSTPAEPAQLSITSFEVEAAASTDDYEPNDTTPFYLGSYGFEYTIDDATIAPTELVYTVEVTNTGAPVTSPFNVEFFRNASSAPVNQLGDVSQELPALDTGARAEVVFRIEDADPGAPMSWAVADANDLIDETDESDNVSSSVTANVAPDVDVYSVYQTANFALNIRLDQLPADYDLELVSPSGTVLARSQNDGLAAEALNGTVTQTGTYAIRVYGFGAARSAQPYRLVITVP